MNKINFFYNNPTIYLSFFLFVGICLGLILKILIGFYVFEYGFGCDYLYIDLINKEFVIGVY